MLRADHALTTVEYPDEALAEPEEEEEIIARAIDRACHMFGQSAFYLASLRVF
jgi:hypothetical protein